MKRDALMARPVVIPLPNRKRSFTTAEALIEEVRNEIFRVGLTYTEIAEGCAWRRSTINNLATGKTRWPRPTTLFPALDEALRWRCGWCARGGANEAYHPTWAAAAHAAVRQGRQRRQGNRMVLNGQAQMRLLPQLQAPHLLSVTHWRRRHTRCRGVAVYPARHRANKGDS